MAHPSAPERDIFKHHSPRAVLLECRDSKGKPSSTLEDFSQHRVRSGCTRGPHTPGTTAQTRKGRVKMGRSFSPSTRHW